MDHIGHIALTDFGLSKENVTDVLSNKMANTTNQKENSFPEKMTKPALYFPTGNDVVAITRTHWTERKNEILQGKPLAILIILAPGILAFWLFFWTSFYAHSLEEK